MTRKQGQRYYDLAKVRRCKIIFWPKQIWDFGKDNQNLETEFPELSRMGLTFVFTPDIPLVMLI